MPRIGIVDGGDVAMPHAIQAFQKQIESTPGGCAIRQFVKTFRPASVASQIAHNVDNDF
jgi:hypothetical protein